MGLLDKLFKKKPIQEVKTEPTMKTYNREFKVAGVTFTNDDNVARQDILKSIKEKRKPFDKKLDIMLKEYDFEGNFAIGITVNGQTIGNIPKDDLEFFQKNGDRMLGVTNIYVGGDDKLYYARIKVTVKNKVQ